ncbi:MAG: hypothetical protein LBE13_02095 [Bacteroidales bacterium]|jgi:type II secretory pathway component GspD/PulD (secretin)|nr:hypothetical protein [Bacteroidales bacterium]
MFKVIFVFILLIFCSCKTVEKNSEPLNYQHQFERSIDSVDHVVSDSRKVLISFEGVPFSQAMSILSNEYNVTIVWSESLDNKLVYGEFSNVPLTDVIRVISKRVGVGVSDVGGVFFVGDIRKEDRVMSVVRLPSVNRQEFLSSVQSAISGNGSVALVGSCVWISDDFSSLKKCLHIIEVLRDRSSRSYMAEVYFIRVSESAFVDFSAQLQFNHVDIFASSFNINQLFSMFLSGDGSLGGARVVQQPVLYVSEGRKVVFTDGQEIIRERSSMSDTGVSTPTSYSRFTDGVSLSLLLNRVRDGLYSVDFDLSISVFDKSDKSSVPASDKSQLVSDGLLVCDSQVYYVGSLKRDNMSRKAGLFSYTDSRSNDILTIWLRVRELKR